MASHLIQDQNSTHIDGLGKKDISKVSTTGGGLDGRKAVKDVFKESKKGGGLGARKALNDISNSAKPSALQASKKSNILSIGKDVDANRIKFSAGKGGRKALTDLTNSSRKPSVQLASQKGKLNIPPCIVEEQSLHDHEKCIKAQRRVMDMDCFLKEVGLDNDIPAQLIPSPRAAPKLCMKSALETPVKHIEVEEMPELELELELMIYDQIPSSSKVGNFGDTSPCVGSPKLASCMDVNFTLIGTPNRPTH